MSASSARPSRHECRTRPSSVLPTNTRKKKRMMAAGVLKYEAMREPCSTMLQYGTPVPMQKAPAAPTSRARRPSRCEVGEAAVKFAI